MYRVMSTTLPPPYASKFRNVTFGVCIIRDHEPGRIAASSRLPTRNRELIVNPLRRSRSRPGTGQSMVRTRAS
jgi:hypothetical protein